MTNKIDDVNKFHSACSLCQDASQAWNKQVTFFLGKYIVELFGFDFINTQQPD